jgi:hypothetical protein
MIFNAMSFLPGMILSLALKTWMYRAVFRWQKITANLMNCVVIAGSGIVVSLIPLFFIPQLLAVVALATYLCSRYTNIPLFPNSVAIAASVEIVAEVVLSYIVWPLIHAF